MEINNNYCIIIPELSKKYLYFIFFIIGSFFRKVIPSVLSDYIFKIKKDKIEFKIERREIYFDIVCNIASDLLTGILHCISEKYKPKKNKKENKKKKRLLFKDKKQKKDLKMLLIVNNKRKNKILLIKVLFIISLIDFICQILLFGNCIIETNKFFNDRNNNDTIIRNADHLYSFLVIDIFSRYLFSLLILKTYFYSHHYLSFILNFIGLLILLFVDIKWKIEKYSPIYLITIIIQYIFYSLEDIMNKVALIYLFINPETLLFYKGLFSLLYLFIFTIIMIIFDDLRFPNFDKKLLANIFMRSYFIVFNIIRSFYIVKVIDVFSSQHISFLRVFETIVLFIFYKIDSYYKKNNKNNSNIFDNYFHLPIIYDFIEVGAFLILLFSTLIHNEIIILNCKKYKRYTIYYLNFEAEKEKLDVNVKDSNNNSNNDSNNENSVDNTQTISSINEVNYGNTNSF